MFNLLSKKFSKLFGEDNESAIDDIMPIINSINELEDSMKAQSDEELRAFSTILRERAIGGESSESLLPEAFALVREVGFRVTGMRHYDVQLIGGIILHQGKIAEMRTGEGKTYVALLPAYLNAIAGKGVHVVTVNDYLAKRDASLMGEVYHALGLSVSVINGQQTNFIYDTTYESPNPEIIEEGVKIQKELLRPCTRKQAYECDITYGTNSEFGFDYLRDNTQYSPESLSQRGHYFVIVDEADSILIDEARVPLILSTGAEQADELYVKCADLSKRLIRDTDYTVDEKLKAIQMTHAGIDKVEAFFGIDNVYSEAYIKLVHYIETAVKARALYHNNVEYVINDNEVVIVDVSTGRMQPGRRWSDGLHQSIEAKEGVHIQEESKTMASITYQNYFKFYTKLSGMTGTAQTSKEEFRKVYNMDVVTTPTHRPITRIDDADVIYQTEHGKFTAIAQKARELQKTGQPVLIGTVAVEKNELLSEYLKKYGVVHAVLNAKNHERESEIIAEAGKKGSVTVATNMAGRGVDIKLGGIPFDKEKEAEIKELGGLYVIGTERHEARRIDNQLRGRSGRQGDPGYTQFYISLEDPLMRIFGGDAVKNMIAKLGIPENEPIHNKFISGQLETAQNRIEGFHFDGRKHTLEYDDVMAHHRNKTYTERRKILFAEKEFMNTFIEEALEEYPDYAELVNDKRAKADEDSFMQTAKRTLLYITDRYWMEYLEAGDEARSSVNLRAYGQREPLVEFKKESARLFHEMDVVRKQEFLDKISKLEILEQTAPTIQITAIENNGTDGQEEDQKIILEKRALANPITERMPIVDKHKKYTRIKKGHSLKDVKTKQLGEYLAAGWEVSDVG